ncbi:MAG: serine/threonine-protein kinase [Polyangiaceae bacterium]
MASTANALPTDPIAAAATERTARGPGVTCEGFAQTRADAAANVTEVPRPGYSAYEPGVIVAQKFQLVRILGEGGMGSVWVAKNLALDVHVALKLIRAELARSVPGLEERLLQEARAAASIEHPAVIQIFDFGLTELRDPFIAMELLHGESLAGTIKRRGKINPLRAVQTLLPITEALLAAHDRGIVHRDLKPDNIFLSRGAGDRLEPKVLDFGIAKFEQKATPNLTSVGTVLGSPAYMSPEQARGEGDVDCRTDVWALSVVLYEVITGRLPFSGENYNALLYAILEGQPKTFSELGINEPLLWSIIARGLEKTRERRCPDMFELGRALAIWLLDRGVQEDVCNALLRSKWMDRPRRKAASDPHEFFPTDPPLDDGQPRTLRSSDETPVPVDENGELSSGVLLRPASVALQNHLFNVPMSRKTGEHALPPTANRSRWVWLTVGCVVLSFSAAVGFAAWAGSVPPPPSEERAQQVEEIPRHSSIPMATVATVVEMPRPSPIASVVQKTTHASAEARVAAPKPAQKWEPKPTPGNELKNPFR